MKIIHCADCHFDCKKFSKFAPEKRELKRFQLLQNFVDMVDYAEENKVTAILMCGDVFDNQKPLKKTMKIVQDTILAHPDITFFHIYGNHDEGVRIFEKAPNNFIFFDNKFSKVDFGDICIGGISFNRYIPSSFYNDIDFQKEDYNIMMMHCPALSSDDYAEQVYLRKIDGKYIDYLALGHVHQKGEGVIDKRGNWAFSGCMESVSFSNLGDDFGFYVLDIKDKKMTRKFVRLSKYNYKIVEVNLTNLHNYNALIKNIDYAMKEVSANDIVRVSFVGSRKEEDNFNLNLALEKYKDKVFYLEIEDNTKIDFDLEKYANERLSLKAEFIKEVMDDDSLTEEEKQKVCLAGIEALKGEDVSL